MEYVYSFDVRGSTGSWESFSTLILVDSQNIPWNQAVLQLYVTELTLLGSGKFPTSNW